jgi:Zn-dependent protease with chaperone function
MELPPQLGSHAVVSKSLPLAPAEGQPVNADAFVEPGTGLAFALAIVVGIFAILLGGLVSYGILWIALLIAPIADYFNRKKAMALLRGSSVAVGPDQFPEIHNAAVTLAQRLGLRAMPEVFVVEGNTINAAAMKVAGRQVIVLLDDIVDACVRSGDPRTLNFILGHEMAHHALGHTGIIRSNLTRLFKKLSRLDEFSCDAVANALVGDSRVSARGICVLTVGPQLLPYLNVTSLIQQAAQVAADKNSTRAERKLTHPLLLNRLSRFGG